MMSTRHPGPHVFQALPFALGFLLPPLVIVSAQAGGWWTMLPIAVVFGAVPVIDAIGGVAAADPDDEGMRALERNVWFRVVTWSWVPVQMALLAWVVAFVHAHALSWPAWIGLAVSTGVCTGTIGITYAHELVHRSSRIERALGEMLLTTVSYAHFAVEHVYGHHRTVATPEDPATARAGESFYRFLPRTLVGGMASAWQLEAGRMIKRHGSVWHPANRLLRYAFVQAAWFAGLALWGGGGVVAFVAVQAGVAVALLEAINYIEHYGLVRRELSPGVYERLQAHHSWDSYSRVSNWLLINLARHADHHGVASRRYQTLRTQETAPQLPAGYGAMFLLALVPPLWHRVMGPRLAEEGRRRR